MSYAWERETSFTNNVTGETNRRWNDHAYESEKQNAPHGVELG